MSPLPKWRMTWPEGRRVLTVPFVYTIGSGGTLARGAPRPTEATPLAGPFSHKNKRKQQKQKPGSVAPGLPLAAGVDALHLVVYDQRGAGRGTPNPQPSLPHRPSFPRPTVRTWECVILPCGLGCDVLRWGQPEYPYWRGEQPSGHTKPTPIASCFTTGEGGIGGSGAMRRPMGWPSPTGRTGVEVRVHELVIREDWRKEG